MSNTKTEKSSEEWALHVVLTLVGILYRPFILADAWLWFVVPTLGVAPLSWTQAFGAGLGIAWLFIPTVPHADQTFPAVLSSWLTRLPVCHLVLRILAEVMA